MAIKPKLDFLTEVEKSISLIFAHKWVLVKLETWCGSFPPEALKFGRTKWRELNLENQFYKLASRWYLNQRPQKEIDTFYQRDIY